MKKRNRRLTGIFLAMVMAILMVFAFALTVSAEELPMAYLTLTDTEIQLSTTRDTVEITYARNISYDTYEGGMMLDSLRAAQWTAGESERLVLGNGGTGIKDGQFNWILILDTTDTDFRLRINKGCMLSGIIDKNGNDVTIPGVVDNYGTIAGGTYSGDVSNYSDSYITGGTFTDSVWNKGYITGGTFTGTVSNVTDGIISGGTFDGTIVDNGGIVELPEEVQSWPILYHYSGHVISSAGGNLGEYEDLAYYTTGTEKTEFLTEEHLKAWIPTGAVEGTLDGWYDYDAIVDEAGNCDLSQFTEANRVTKIPADSTGEVNLLGRWKYHLTVENGTGSGDYYEEEIVTITADAPGDRVFLGWTNSEDVPSYFVGDPTSPTTTIRVEPNLTVTANYHTHAWNEEWVITETHHWRECEDENCPVTADSEKSGYGTHTMAYTVDGTTIFQSCICGVTGGSVTLIDPDADEALVYDGQPKTVSTTGTIDGVNPVITYSTADGSAPVEPGTYTADMTIEGQRVCVEYVIGKLESQIGTVTCEMDVVYEDSTVVLTHENTAVPGTLRLVEETLTVGTQEYHWEFIPEDSDRYEVETGTITLTVYDRFDINLDGVLNLLDVTRAQRSYGKTDAIADLDDSGMVDIQDLILILNYVYG